MSFARKRILPGAWWLPLLCCVALSISCTERLQLLLTRA